MPDDVTPEQAAMDAALAAERDEREAARPDACAICGGPVDFIVALGGTEYAVCGVHGGTMVMPRGQFPKAGAGA